MLSSLATNYNRRNKNVHLYELGNIYIPKALPLTELPDERMQFTLGFYGDGDFYTMKGVIEEFLSQVGLHKQIEYVRSDKTFLHPGRQAYVEYEGKTLGYFGEVHPMVLRNYEIGQRAYIAVIDMPEVMPFATFDRHYTGIAKFPAVTRDISMLVPLDTDAASVEKMLRQRGGKILEDLKLFDLYEGDQVEQGYKSMAYSLTFRSREKTLTDDDINGAMKKIYNGLEHMDIKLRS